MTNEKREKTEYTPRVVPNARPVPPGATITPDTGNTPKEVEEQDEEE